MLLVARPRVPRVADPMDGRMETSRPSTLFHLRVRSAGVPVPPRRSRITVCVFYVLFMGVELPSFNFLCPNDASIRRARSRRYVGKKGKKKIVESQKCEIAYDCHMFGDDCEISRDEASK